MREFKFRAWDKREGLQQMMYLNGFIMYGEGWTGGNPAYKFIELNFANGGFGKWSFDDIVLMQFSGLRDKNGREIYEGDIVQRGIIVFHNGKFQGNYFEDGGSLAETWEDDLYQERNIEVLGNIYEHPNLLQL